MTDREWLLSILEDGHPHSQAAILRASFEQRGYGLTVHSRVADLRADGYLITCDRVPGAVRGHAWEYRLLAEPAADTPILSRRPAWDTSGSAGVPGGTAGSADRTAVQLVLLSEPMKEPAWR